jgi:protein-S-isoprenylcysteine O-methyltransferase Ste14
MHPAMNTHPKPPPSVTGPAVMLAALFGIAVGCLVVFGIDPGWNRAASALFLVAAMALPCAAVEFALLRHRPGSGFDFGRPRLSVHRVVRKLTALWAILAVLLLCYAVLPLYRTELYQPFHWLLRNAMFPFLLASIPYVALVDAFQTEPEDSLHALGERLLNGSARLGRKDLNYLLGWVVKAFFLPLMFSYLSWKVDTISAFRLAEVPPASLREVVSQVYDVAYAAIFFIDVLVATAGYLMTMRLLGTEIRSVEPTVAGWLVAIACYDPFWPSLFDSFFRYTHERSWGIWLEAYPLLYTLWAAAIMAVLGVYVWAALSFGIRFSNLTHRGIITSGPYRFTKHPAYVAKNISWWLVSIPFLPADGSPFTALQLCLGLLGINVIYLLRARTEERHLSQDPVYRAYAAHIRAHGIFRWLPPPIRDISSPAPGILPGTGEAIQNNQ